MSPFESDRTQTEPAAAAAHPSLEEPALSDGPPGTWACKLYREAGEATLWLVPRPPTRPPAPAVEPTAEATAATAADGARRAAGEVRRYVRANRLDHMWTFTFAAGVIDYAALALAVETFLRRLRDAGYRGPLVLVPEPHPLGHGWHLHGALRGRLPHGKMSRLWGHGYVWVTGPSGKSRGGWRPRKLSSYLAKYLGKELAGEELHGCRPRPKGGHRYFVTAGFEPRLERWTFDSLAQALRYLERSMGLADVVLPFAASERYTLEGYWLSWPDPPRRRPPAPA